MKLMDDFESADLEVSMATGGGQSSLYVHPEGFDLDIKTQTNPEVTKIGSTGVGGQIAF
jgi:hypothetical protein